jgi:RNA polymerase sigma factor (sigma-70 family)
VLPYTGALEHVTAEPRAFFTTALLANAAGLTLFHLHPSSGDPTPSPADLDSTRQMLWAGELVGVRVLDHPVLGEPPSYVSIRRLARGKWPPPRRPSAWGAGPRRPGAGRPAAREARGRPAGPPPTCVTNAVGDFRGYVLSSAINQTIDFLRRRRARKRQASAATNGNSAAPLPAWPATLEQTLLARDELRHQLAHCRHLLAARQYRIFTLIYVAGYTNREVGARIGLHTSSVDSALHRLRRSLGEQDVVIRPRTRRREQEEAQPGC